MTRTSEDGCSTPCPRGPGRTTIIRPPLGKEFDADFLVQLAEDTSWNADPQKYSDAICEALSNHGIYKITTTQKNRCVRVRYANFCHVDIVAYVVRSDGYEVIVNRTTNNFETTNPIGFTSWLQEKDDLTSATFARSFAYSSTSETGKAPSPSSPSCSPPSSATLSTRGAPSTPTTTKTCPPPWSTRPGGPGRLAASPTIQAADHRSQLSDHFVRPSLDRRAVRGLPGQNPSTRPRRPGCLRHRGNRRQHRSWRGVFGDAFPKSLTGAPLSAASVLRKIAPRAGRAPKEEFIEDKVEVDVTHGVIVACEVSEPTPLNRAARRALRSPANRVPKHRELLFTITDTDVPTPFQVFWKARNTGEEAKRIGQLRGEIHPDEGHHQRKESTLYAGHHWMECCIVKDGVCVARAHEPVLIA